MLLEGDCLRLMPQIAPESVDCVFLDPPFNLKKKYGPKCDDDMPAATYRAWLNAVLLESVRTLKPGGALFFYHLPKHAFQSAHTLELLGLEFRHWIAIEMKSRLPIPKKLYPAHYALLYFTKGPPAKFERPRIPIAKCRHCGKDVKDYGGHRNKLNPKGINLSDVWTDLSPVRHAKTKTRKANQLPGKLLERCIEMTTSPGDLVLDPFLGSGTTARVCERLNRRWLGIEINPVENKTCHSRYPA